MHFFSRDNAQPFTTADGSTIRELLHPNFSNARNQSLAEATLLPGAATTEHYHPRAEEIYYIQGGQGRMKLEDETRDVTAGDVILIAPGQKHTIRNIGETPLIFLCCCAPAYSHEDTILTGNEPNPRPLP